MSSPRLHGTSEHVGGSLPARSDALRSVNSDGISYILGHASNTPSIRSLSSAHNATSSDDHPEPIHVELQSLLSSGQQVSSELRASSPAPTVSALSVGSNQANTTSASPTELRKPAQSYSRWQKYRRYCKDSWLPEFLVMLLSISCTVAIAAVLKAYDGRRAPNLPEVINLNAIISTLATASGSSMLFAVSSAMGQVKWDWIREQHRPLRDLDLLDEASRGPLGSIEMLFHRTIFSVASLGSVVTLLNLAVGPFVQQITQFQTAPVPRSLDSVKTPKMVFPGRYLNASNDIVDAINSGIWNDVSPRQRATTCPTGNCVWPPFDSLDWCVQLQITQDLGQVKVDCPIAYNEDSFSSIYQDFSMNGVYKTNSTTCSVYMKDASTPLTYPIVFSLEGGRGPLVTNPAGEEPSFKTTLPLELAAPIRVSNGTPDGSTYLGIPDPVLVMGYARFSQSTAEENSTVVVEAAEQVVVSLCARRYNVTVTNGDVATQILSQRDGRFYTDAAAAERLGSDDTWCWSPEAQAPELTGPVLTYEGVPYLLDARTMSFCVGEALSLGANVADRISSLYTLSMEKGSANGTVAYSTGSWTSNEDILKRIRFRGLSFIVGSGITSALQSLYNSDLFSGAIATGAALTDETFVHVRWPWFILPVAVEVMGLVFLLLVAYGIKRNRPLWKGSILAALYHGVQDAPDNGESLETASGMSAAADQTRVMLKQASDGTAGASVLRVSVATTKNHT